MRLIKKYRPECDILIVTFHGGGEGVKYERLTKKMECYYRSPRGNVFLFARTAVDHGADLVVGHGPHVLRAMEVYKKKLIAYSLGNFIGYAKFSVSGKKGYSVYLEAVTDSRGDLLHGFNSFLLRHYLTACSSPVSDGSADKQNSQQDQPNPSLEGKLDFRCRGPVPAAGT